MASKPAFPGCEQALLKYYELRKRLHNYFFHNVELKITNTETILAYSDVYNLIDKNPQMRINNEKIYNIYEATFFEIFKKDLTTFCQEVRQNLISKKCTPSPIDELGFYYEWIINYTWFLRWTHKILSSIQKNISVFSQTSLYYVGLSIMKDEIIEPLYPNIFRLVMANLQLFKQGQLQQFSQLQFIIQVIGMCGFKKYFYIKLQKNDSGFFHFVSTNKQNQLKSQDEYETDYFMKRFISQYVKYLKTKYTKIAEQMILLSTSQYVNRATQYLERQTMAAQYFYSNTNTKNIIIRSIEETIIANHCKQLIYNQKSGLSYMIESQNIDGLKNLYKLTKRTSQQKIFGQCYQEIIQKYIGEEILNKLTPEEERAAKRQTVMGAINSLYDYYLKIDRITKSIHEFQKDPYDLILPSSQMNGFQQACNRNNTFCIFLAFYCDAMLKKQQNAAETSSKELVIRVSKMLKFMYSLDQFLKIYQKMLGLRILYDAFKNKQTEMQLISMMKNEVGIATISKITTVIQDYKFSENFNSERTKQFRNSVPFNFSVILLTSGAWQIQDLKNNKKLVPPELMKAVQVFQQQYNKAYSGRDLTWIFNHGRAIAQVKFNDQTKVLLMLNNYQLLVILFLQRRNFQSTKIIQIISQIKPQEEPALMASLMALVKKGVLIKQGHQAKIESKNESVSFNFDLKLKVLKLGCFEVPRFSQKLPSVSNQLTAERAFIVQANIVKLMKSKRILRFQQIVTEVIAMCKTFKADSFMVKNQIQICIHKQLLERDPKDFNVLLYKP